jgi:hypothetical protein
MTDLPAYYPEALILEVTKRLAKGLKIHTLVLWTKHIHSLFREPLYSFLNELKLSNTQLFIHLTITGMGRVVIGNDLLGKPVILEPNVPSAPESLNKIPALVALTENADRIRLRIDPLVQIKDPEGTIYSNYSQLDEIIRISFPMGIRNYTFSFLESTAYAKVDKRFSNKGLIILSPDFVQRQKIHQQVKWLEKKYPINISSCCVPGMNTSRCINGYALQDLHNLKIPISKKEPRSRPLCGCTESIDIGGWPPKICYSGCLYCYSRPSVNPTLNHPYSL